MSGSGAIGIELLLPGVSPEAFLCGYWPDRWLVGRGSLERFAERLDVARLSDLEYVLSRWQGPVPLLAPEPPFSCAVSEAMERYREGRTLYLLHAERSLPELTGQGEQLELDLQVPPGCVYFNLFASRDGSGSPPHSDADHGFNLQLAGAKRWLIAPPADPHPIESTSEDFEATDELLLEPGDVFFNPRGWLHRTRVEGDSVSLDFTVDAGFWGRYLMDLLRARLAGHEILLHTPARLRSPEAWDALAAGLDAAFGELGALARERPGRALLARALGLPPGLDLDTRVHLARSADAPDPASAGILAQLQEAATGTLTLGALLAANRGLATPRLVAALERLREAGIVLLEGG